MFKVTDWVVYLLIGLSIVLCLGNYTEIQAQNLRPEAVAPEVYRLLPDFPKENHYLRQDTNTRDEDNTLVNRFISYHQFVKRRPLVFRFDWKLTLADYLGVNEKILAQGYPGHNTLTTNPLESDLAAIQALNLRQRNQLVEVLMEIYRPQVEEENPSTEETTPSPASPSLPLPQPGDAELLQP